MNTSIMNTTEPKTFGAGKSIIDVTENFDGEAWHENGEGLSTGYLHLTCLENVTNDGPWDAHYEGNGHDLSLYRDPENCYWNLQFNESAQSYKLHYVGERKDAIALGADYRVRVWDENFSAEWFVVNDKPVILTSGGIPNSIIESATDTLVLKMAEGLRLNTIENYVACEFVGDDKDTSNDEDHTPECSIETIY